MATTATAIATLRMKLHIDNKAQRVLFAEASNDVTDFLFSLLALPVGTAVKLIGKESMVGSVGNLYASVEKLDGTYVQSRAAKEALLRPVFLSPAVSANSSQLFLLAEPKKFFKCGYGCNQMTAALPFLLMDASNAKCPSCRNQMTEVLVYLSPAPGGSGQQVSSGSTGGSKGFVQGVVTYTVTDDLIVTPLSSISSIAALLNAFAVKDLGALEEKTVQLGYKEGLEILKASLQSKTVLTDVFLGKKLASRPPNRA